MSFDGIQRYVTRIDLRTMRAKGKQEYVDTIRREYTAQRLATWEPEDATETWIKDSRGGELFLEFLARQLQQDTLEQEQNNETVAHPLIHALTGLSKEARTVVWILTDNQIEYDTLGPPGDSGGDIEKA